MCAFTAYIASLLASALPDNQRLFDCGTHGIFPGCRFCYQERFLLQLHIVVALRPVIYLNDP